MSDRGPIIVALDGSELAEGVLPYAEAMGKALGERLILLAVWEEAEEELTSSFPSMAREISAKAQEHFDQYLARAKQRVAAVKADTAIRTGTAHTEIMRAAEESGARMIAIATHGRSGLNRWLYGSTAGHLLRSGKRQVLAVGPQALEHKPAQVAFGHIMCPLDGSAASEAALDVATDLARKTGARLSLVRVVRWAVQAYPYTLPDAYIPQVDQELEAAAKAYLQEKEAAIKDVERSAFVVRGAIAEGLLDFIEKQGVDLVVMTTHARGGLARAALGSVADRMLHAPVPVLMIPPSDA